MSSCPTKTECTSFYDASLLRKNIHVRVNADYEVTGLELRLGLNLSVNHILQNGVPAIVVDDLQGELFIFGRLDYVDLSTGALTDFSVPPVHYAVNLYLFVRQHGK